MQTIIGVTAFILGTTVGSAINALDWRQGKDKSWLADRSQCPQCGHTLRWFELVPVLSFVFQAGRCRNCRNRISLRYTLVELCGGGLFLATVLAFGLTIEAVFMLAIVSVLLFIYLHDTRTFIIPNSAVWTFNVLAATSLFVNFTAAGETLATLFNLETLIVWPGWTAIFAGPAVAAPLFLLWLFSSGRAMGFGDVKLAIGIGWLVGLADGFSALVFAFWIGAVISLAILGVQRIRPRISELEDCLLGLLHTFGVKCGVWKSRSPETKKESTIKREVSAGKRSGGQNTDPNKASANRLNLRSAVPFGPFLILGLLGNLFFGLSLF
jgi:leader peptidase (prepilin peptidase)/N-methyltransferase